MMMRALRSVLGLSLAIAAATAPGAALGLHEAGTAIDGRHVQIPVRLSLGAHDSVAGFQFDLHFNEALLQFDRAETAPATVAAEKSAHANVMRPGLLRVVVAGFNQNAIAAGDVLGLRFSTTGAEREAAAFRLAEVILSDPFGSAVPVEVVPDTLIVSGGTARAVTAGGAAAATTPRDGIALYRYRAVVFAAIVVALTMLFARSKPKKGRAR